MNLPNKISTVRIAAIPVFVTLFLLDGIIPYARIIATIVFVLAALTDFLDGYIARKYNLVTNLGKFLDPIADKLLVAAALFLLVEARIGFAPYTAVCAIIIIARELIISAFRQVAAGENIIMHADKLGKIKTVFQDFALVVLLPCTDISGAGGEWLGYIGFGLLVVATVLTIVSGANYIIKNRQVLTKKSAETKS